MSGDALGLGDLLFYATAAVTVGCAAFAVFSRNIVRAMFSLLGTFLGVAVFYGMLAADFVAVVQLMVYVGGILVLLLFAVMLTSQIDSATRSNPGGGWLLGSGAALAIFGLLAFSAWLVPWKQVPDAVPGPTASAIGERIAGDLALPFELFGLLMVAVVVGSVAIARRHRRPEEDR